MKKRPPVEAHLYNQLCADLLIDPEQVSQEIVALVQAIEVSMAELRGVVAMATTPPPPTRKDTAS